MPPKTSYVLTNVLKNAAAPVVLPVARGRGSLGMDGEPEAVAATLRQLLAGIERLGISLRGTNVIELGSGRTPEVALGLAAFGAGSVHGVDVTVQIPRDWREATSRATRIAASVARDRVSDSRGDDGLLERVRFSRYDGVHLPAADGTIDLLVSKSVLEHVSSRAVLPLLRDMRRVLRVGGGAVHLIDLRDHMFIDGDDVCGDWLDALRYPDSLFNAMFSNRSTSINRFRACEWRELFESAGLWVVCLEPLRYALPDHFDRARLAPRWRELPEEELTIGQVMFVVRREGS